MSSESENQQTTTRESPVSGAHDIHEPRYGALVQIEVGFSDFVGRNLQSERRGSLDVSYRHALMNVLRTSDAIAAVSKADSLIAMFAVPSQAVQFVVNARQALSSIGLRSRAALHLDWVVWSAGEFDFPGKDALTGAVGKSVFGQVVATAEFQMALYGSGHVWKALNKPNTPALPAGQEVYELVQLPLADGSHLASWISERDHRRKRTSGTLSRRERQVAALVARGESNRQVASALHIATSTVERHVSNLMGKLDVRSRVDVAVLAATGQI